MPGNYQMKKSNLILLFCIAMLAFACHKDSPLVHPTPGNPNLSGANKLLSFSVGSQMAAATIDTSARTVSVIIPAAINRVALSVSVSISADAVASINNVAYANTITADFTKPVSLQIKAANGTISNWTINVITDLEYYGLGGTITAQKSITKTFEWYYDQGNTGTYSSINCGPTVTTMAAKWADSTFSRTPEDARKAILSTGGWWYTNNIVDYLKTYGVNTAYTALPDNYQTIKKYLDKNYIVILCLDNYYMRYNADPVVHIDKYYKVNATGSGHFIVVKGYKQIDGKFYFESYDPWSLGVTYALDGSLKGKSRYYLSDDLEQATGVWWDYAIIVAPKGKTVALSDANGLKIQSLSNIPAQKGA